MNTQDQHGRREDCPEWCVANHALQLHIDDAWHEGVGSTIPIVEQRTQMRRGIAWRLVLGAEIDVLLEQHVDGAEPFILFGVGTERERNFHITVESARRLIRELVAVVAIADGCTPSVPQVVDEAQPRTHR